MADESPTWAGAANNNVASNTASVGSNNDVEDNMNVYMKALRYINGIMGVLYVFAAIYAYAEGDINGPADFFASVYTIFFGLLLLAYEIRIARIESKVQHYFGFLYKAWGRSLYLLFIGTIPLGLGTCGQVIGIIMLCNAGLNMYLLCQYPISFKNKKVQGSYEPPATAS